MCVFVLREVQRIHRVLLGLQLDLQEGRTRVCMRREGNQFSLDLTITPTETSGSHIYTKSVYLVESDSKHTNIYSRFINTFENLLF